MVNPAHIQFLLSCKPDIARLRARLETAKAAKKTELHIALPDVELMLRLAEGILHLTEHVHKETSP
jgi:hypothetical protein